MSPRTRQSLLRAAAMIGQVQNDVQSAAFAKAYPQAKRKLGQLVGYRYAPTDMHKEIVQALNDDLPDEEAMGLLHTHDAMEQRFSKETN